MILYDLPYIYNNVLVPILVLDQLPPCTHVRQARYVNVNCPYYKMILGFMTIGQYGQCILDN